MYPKENFELRFADELRIDTVLDSWNCNVNISQNSNNFLSDCYTSETSQTGYVLRASYLCKSLRFENCLNGGIEDGIASQWKPQATHSCFVFFSTTAMYSIPLFICILTLLANILKGKTIRENVLRLSHLTTCTYNYEVSVHTARGSQTTFSDGCQVHALVRDFSLLYIYIKSSGLICFENCKAKSTIRTIRKYCSAAFIKVVTRKNWISSSDPKVRTTL